MTDWKKQFRTRFGSKDRPENVYFTEPELLQLEEFIDQLLSDSRGELIGEIEKIACKQYDSIEHQFYYEISGANLNVLKPARPQELECDMCGTTEGVRTYNLCLTDTPEGAALEEDQ